MKYTSSKPSENLLFWRASLLLEIHVTEKKTSATKYNKLIGIVTSKTFKSPERPYTLINLPQDITKRTVWYVKKT